MAPVVGSTLTGISPGPCLQIDKYWFGCIMCGMNRCQVNLVSKAVAKELAYSIRGQDVDRKQLYVSLEFWTVQGGRLTLCKSPP
jgi:hypothetical protein